jgi:hypothetical protein
MRVVQIYTGFNSQRVELIEPLNQCFFVNAPLTANLESRQLLAMNHAVQGASRDLQQLGGLSDSQEF